MAVFPSRQWIESVLEAADKSDEYKEAAKDWEGDFLCIIHCDEEFLEDLSRKEVIEGFLTFLDMMPSEGKRKYKGSPLGDLFEKKLGVSLDASTKEWDPDDMASKISSLSAEDVSGAELYFWADFWHGRVRSMTGVAPGEHEDAAFKLSGKYSSWKLLVSGQQDTMRLVMSNRLELEGDIQYMMKRMKAVVALSKEVLSVVPID
jgi:putative sterol carrier protein